MKKKSFPVTNIGTISLMMIFIVLCMVTFAALSLSSAAGDARLGQRMSEHMQEYYAASNQAEEVLSAVDAILAEAYEAAADTDDYFSRILAGLSDTIDIRMEGENMKASYQATVNDTQALSVEISILSPEQIAEENAESFYRILSWQIVHTDAWEGDNTLHLM